MKVGDKVLVKSLEWYEDNKDENGCVPLKVWGFSESMRHLCGSKLTISKIHEDDVYSVEENVFFWTDEMFESVEPERPPHYDSMFIDVYDFCYANNIGMLEGNIIKYITRQKEDRLGDLEKARNTIDRLIEFEKDVPR